MKKVAVYAGEDGFSRPTFKSDDGQYYCLLDLVYGSDEEGKKLAAMIDEANSIEGLINIKGRKFDDEPSHPVNNLRLSLSREEQA